MREGRRQTSLRYAAAAGGALPADLVYMLISRVGLVEAEVAGMSKDEAIVRLQRYWTEGT